MCLFSHILFIFSYTINHPDQKPSATPEQTCFFRDPEPAVDLF